MKTIAEDMDWMKGGINKLAELEQARSNVIHEPKFNSMVEGHGIIKEEVEESLEALKVVAKYLKRLWYSGVRKDDEKRAVKMVKCLRENAVHATGEMVQVIAMCDKFLDSLEDVNDDRTGEKA